MSKEDIIRDLQEYKNYLKALEYYKEYGDKYGDGITIALYESKHKDEIEDKEVKKK